MPRVMLRGRHDGHDGLDLFKPKDGSYAGKTRQKKGPNAGVARIPTKTLEQKMGLPPARV